MKKNDAIKLWKNDRVLWDGGRYGFIEGIIVEISPSREYFKLEYDEVVETADWVPVECIKERLPYKTPTPKKTGWFS